MSQQTGEPILPNCQNLHQTLNEFRLNNVLCDVTIMDDVGGSTQAHSCILAASSPVLKSTVLLKDTNKMLIGQGLTLVIADISIDVWNLILDYLYLNTLIIPALPGVMEAVAKAANMLGMKDLQTLIMSHVEGAGIELGDLGEHTSLKITLAPTKVTPQTNAQNAQTGNKILLLV